MQSFSDESHQFGQFFTNYAWKYNQNYKLTNSLDLELDLGKQTAWNLNYTITTQINSLELELNLIRTGHIRLKGEGFSNVSMED